MKADNLDGFISSIHSNLTPGTVIPKPQATADFTIKGWGKRRREVAIIYRIPNLKGGKAYEKGITVSELKSAFSQLVARGTFERKWFNTHLSACAKEGGCNFTTIGGIFELPGYASYKSTRFRHTKNKI